MKIMPFDDPAAFMARHYEREEPVILRGATLDAVGAAELARTLQAKIDRDEPDEADTLLWHDVHPELIDRIFPTPPFIRSLLDRELLREKHVRVWLSVRGHRTPWHYDGNSLHVFNLQLRGRKRWRIVSPETPLLCLPFSNLGMCRDYSLAGRKSFEFETGPGDLLFLPRYWFHSVESMDDLNINLNWVLTPKRSPIATPTARREAEMMWIKRRLYPIMPPGVREAVDTYAGQGRPAIDALTKSVSAGSCIARGLRETLKLPVFLAHLPAQLAMLFAMKRNRRLLTSRLT